MALVPLTQSPLDSKIARAFASQGIAPSFIKVDTVNAQLHIDNLNISKYTSNIPHPIVQARTVHIEDAQLLQSLTNMPYNATSVQITDTPISSLEGMTTVVTKDVTLTKLPYLRSLQYFPSSTDIDITLEDLPKVTELGFLPTRVNDITVSNLGISSLQGFPRVANRVFVIQRNFTSIESLKGLPKQCRELLIDTSISDFSQFGKLFYGHVIPVISLYFTGVVPKNILSLCMLESVQTVEIYGGTPNTSLILDASEKDPFDMQERLIAAGLSGMANF